MTHGPEFTLVEKPAIDYLESLGYTYLPPSQHPFHREGENNVILRKIFIEAIQRINNIDEDTAAAVYQDLLRIDDNHELTRMMRGNYSRAVAGEKTRQTIQLIDFHDTSRNTFTVTNQFYVKAQKSRIPDLVVFVNGLPLVVIEAKSPVSAKDKTGEAFEQIKQYERDIPRLFLSNAFNIITDGVSLLYGATESPSQYWASWKDPWPKKVHDFGNGMEQGLNSLLKPSRLLDILAHFILFEVDKDTGHTIKKMCRYHQFRAVNKLFDRVVEQKHRRGLVWHTQGSGKSLTMVFTALKLKTHLTADDPTLYNPNVLVLTDRVDLDDQITATFEACGIQNPVQIDSVSDLHGAIRQQAHGLMLLSTIFKFQGSNEPVEDSENWILLVDECHRTQEKDLGACLRATFPQARFFGFTGTPVKKNDKDTYANFGAEGESYLDKYSIDDAVADGATVPIHYTSRMAEWHVDPKKIDVLFDNWFASEPDEVIDKLKKRGVTLAQLAKHSKRVELIAFDAWTHFKEYARPDGLKAQVVGIDREAVVLYKQALDRIITEDFIQMGVAEAEAEKQAAAMSACVYSTDQNDQKPSEDSEIQRRRDLLKRYYNDTDHEDGVVQSFCKKGENPQILLVCNKLLTGFDAPIEGVMYLDNPLTEHSLLQAIARTNRVWRGGEKANGLIVDYIGISKRLDEALSSYREGDVKNAMRNIDALVQELKASHKQAMDMVKGVRRSIADHKESFEELKQALGSLDVWLSFKKKAKAFVRAYSALSPHPAILDYQSDLKWVAIMIPKGTMTFEKKESHDLKDYSQKIRAMLEEQLEVTGIRTVCKLRKITDPAFWQDFEPEIGGKDLETAAVRKASELKKTTSEKVDENKMRYGAFSERVLEAIRKLEEGQISAAEAMEDFEKIAQALINEDRAYESSGLSREGYDIYKILQKMGLKRSEETASGAKKTPGRKADRKSEDLVLAGLKQVAHEIEKLYRSDSSAPRGWHERDSLRRELRGRVRRVAKRANVEAWRELPPVVEEYALKTFIKQ